MVSLSVPDPTATQKTALRLEMRNRLHALDANSRAERSRRLVDCLIALPAWRSARKILLFAPLPNEPDLDLLWSQGALAGKQCAYPRIDGDQLRIFGVNSLAELASTRWRLREPAVLPDRELPPADFDLILAPGLAFTHNGKRLGRGGGYYDRLLAAAGSAPRRVGIAFAVQLVPDFPTAAHDARVDLVITDALNGPAPRDELNQDHDDRQHQQDVNETADGAPADDAEQPKND